MVNKSNMNRLAAVLVSCLAVVGCSNSGDGSFGNNNGGSSGDANSLQVITPRAIYSRSSVAGGSYVVINNPTNTAIKNLQYSIANQVGSGIGAKVESTSAANCATIAAYSQCNIKVTVPAGAVAGSLGLSVSNDTSLLGKLSKVVKAATPTPTMGIEQAAYNNLSGADGITLSYYHTVINGTPYILVSGLVASANAGTFNKIVLVNASGVVIPNQELIGSVSNIQGSTFNLLLPVPSGNNSSQTIKVQTQQITAGKTTIVSTATTSSTLTTVQNVGIAEMLPSAVYLSESNPEQIITFANTGNSAAQLQQLISNNPNIEVIFSPTSLSAGTTSTATLKLKDQTIAATTGNIILTYYNGQNETATSGTVEQNVTPTPIPIPTPTPSPSPSPSPGPAPSPPPPAVAGLTAVFSPDDDFFTTTAIGSVTRQLTLTNTGNTDEYGIVLTLPANFTISGGVNNSCTVSGSNITNTLTAGTGNCDVTVTYINSSVVDPAQTNNISIAYNYNSGMVATPILTAVDYQVTQSTANLSLSPNTSQNYGTIVSDNTQLSSTISYVVTNSGDETASGLAFNFGGSDASLFHAIGGGTCSSGGTLSSTPGTNTCTVNTQFGTAPNGSAGSKTATFNVGYTPYTGGAPTTTANVTLNGTVTAAPSATYTSAYNDSTSNPFVSGSGTSGNEYQGQVNTDYKINVVYTNSSAVAATGFTTTYTSPPAGWSMTTHGCNNVSMSANGTCTDVYTLNSAATGTTSINLANVTANWTDSSGVYAGQVMSGATVYASLAAAPAPTPASWSQVGGADISNSLPINSIIFSGSDLYAGGETSSNTGAVWKYNGTSWSQVGGAAISGSSFVNSIALSGSDLYAGGETSSTAGAVWKYNGTSWSQVGGADISSSLTINSIIFYGSDLYAGGKGSGGAVWSYK